MIQFLENIIANENIKIFILSMLPITELRFSIPYGILYYDIPISNTIALSILGNILIGVIVIYLIGPLMTYFRRFNLISTVIDYIFKRTRRKGQIVNNMKFLGLIIFVGLPLPLTGVWTGSLAAYLFGIRRKKSILAIVFGVLISSTIVTTLTLTGKSLL